MLRAMQGRVSKIELAGFIILLVGLIFTIQMAISIQAGLNLMQ